MIETGRSEVGIPDHLALESVRARLRSRLAPSHSNHKFVLVFLFGILFLVEAFAHAIAKRNHSLCVDHIHGVLILLSVVPRFVSSLCASQRKSAMTTSFLQMLAIQGVLYLFFRL